MIMIALSLYFEKLIHGDDHREDTVHEKYIMDGDRYVRFCFDVHCIIQT